MVVSKPMVMTMMVLIFEPDFFIIHSIFQKLENGLGSIVLVICGEPPLIHLYGVYTKVGMPMVVSKPMVMTMMVLIFEPDFSLSTAFSNSQKMV